MASNLQRFLGGSPGSVLVKLLFLSLLVGAFMAFLDITPFALVDRMIRWLRSLFSLSFDTVREVGRWVLYGTVVVLPIWVVTRIFSRNG
jgi:Family of unknown function (DUF6460)